MVNWEGLLPNNIGKVYQKIALGKGQHGSQDQMILITWLVKQWRLAQMVETTKIGIPYRLRQAYKFYSCIAVAAHD